MSRNNEDRDVLEDAWKDRDDALREQQIELEMLEQLEELEKNVNFAPNVLSLSPIPTAREETIMPATTGSVKRKFSEETPVLIEDYVVTEEPEEGNSLKVLVTLTQNTHVTLSIENKVRPRVHRRRMLKQWQTERKSRFRCLFWSWTSKVRYIT